MQFKVYVLYSLKFDKLFTGMTTSLTDRMITHNGEEPDDWTSGFRPWTLVHMELYQEKIDAVLRESFFESEVGQTYIREDILPLFEF